MAKFKFIKVAKYMGVVAGASLFLSSNMIGVDLFSYIPADLGITDYVQMAVGGLATWAGIVAVQKK